MKSRGRRRASVEGYCRTETLAFASSNLLLTIGFLLVSIKWSTWNSAEEEDALDWTGTQQSAFAGMAINTVQKWATSSGLVSLLGVVGIVMNQRHLIRLYAVGAAIDLCCTIVLCLVLGLLTFFSTLATPFSSFLCTAITSGETFAQHGSTTLTHGDHDSRPWVSIERCEESWRWGMLVVMGGAAIAIGLRAWGTALTWQHYGAVSKMQQQQWQGISSHGHAGGVLADDSDGDEGWYTELPMKSRSEDHSQEPLSTSDRTSPRRSNSRRRSSNSRSDRDRLRSSTLPVMMPHAGSHHRYSHPTLFGGRIRSHSVSSAAEMEQLGSGIGSAGPSSSSRRPQLVLVPVFYDSETARTGHSASSSPSSRTSSSSDRPSLYYSPRDSRIYARSPSQSPARRSSTSSSASVASASKSRRQSSVSSSSSSRSSFSIDVGTRSSDSPPTYRCYEEPAEIEIETSADDDLNSPARNRPTMRRGRSQSETSAAGLLLNLSPHHGDLFSRQPQQPQHRPPRNLHLHSPVPVRPPVLAHGLDEESSVGMPTAMTAPMVASVAA